MTGSVVPQIHPESSKYSRERQKARDAPCHVELTWCSKKSRPAYSSTCMVSNAHHHDRALVISTTTLAILSPSLKFTMLLATWQRMARRNARLLLITIFCSGLQSQRAPQTKLESWLITKSTSLTKKPKLHLHVKLHKPNCAHIIEKLACCKLNCVLCFMSN